MRYPFDTLHNPIVFYQAPDAKYSPSFEKAMLCTLP